MKKFILLFSLLSSFSFFAQGEANNWFFGQNAGINFNNTSTTRTTGRLDTYEGCASFSDKNGNLLFYTDGKFVWDKTHQPMPNGNGTLKGNNSSTQSAIIVPNPLNNNLFYIFTVGANTQNNDGEFFPTEGLYCYTVDITKNSGLGDIVGTPIPLSGGKNAYWTEKITSVKGSECNTFWVISLVDNTFYSYKIDDMVGLNSTPIISKVNYQAADSRGYLKASPNGTKLASATYTAGTNRNGDFFLGEAKFHLYSFNDATGTVSNDGIALISNAAIDGSPYGVEFSPRSTKLYCSTFDGENNKLYQFDLENANSKTLIKSQTGYRGALQLAPNGKIYATVPVSYNRGTNFLDAINSPDELGTKCNYKLDELNLAPAMAMQGLPPFIASLLLPIEITSVEKNNEIITNQTLKLCVGSDYTFNTENLAGTPSYSWTHNNIEVNTTSSFTIQNIQLADAGIYVLEVNLIDSCGFPIIYKGNFEIETYIPPSDFSTIVYDQCDIDDNSTDGSTIFNLNNKLTKITNNDPNLEVEFYKSQADLDSNTPISNSHEYTASNSSQLLIKVTNKLSGCYTSGFMELNAYPTSLDAYDTIYTCENDLANDNDTQSVGSGIGSFDFETKRQSIESIFSDPNIEVQFFKTTNDAQLQINPINGITDFPNMEVFVKISNKTTKNCISVGKFNLIINPVPIPKSNDDIIILCVNNPRDNPQLFTVQLDGDTGVFDDTYQWYFNGNMISGASNATVDANAEGIYTVEVTHTYENNLMDLNDDSYCVGFNTYKVVESNLAIINYSNIAITDDSINNSIKINTSNQNLGSGDYEFMLVDIEGFTEYPYQNDPYFENVKAGIHTIFIQDKKGCGVSEIEVSILGFPKFFTPNNDGHNDKWSILGVNENFYANSKIYIFDRFGKLITYVKPNEAGWDGFFKGQQLPGTDYWFTAELIDRDGNLRTRKGHFSLIR